MIAVTLSRGLQVTLAFGSVAIMALAGCDKTETQVPAAVVNCNIVVVLALGDTLGNRSNQGCRLTAQEVREYMNGLNVFAQNYGRNVQFIWNDPPFEFVWPAPISDPMIRGLNIGLFWGHALQPSGVIQYPYYDASKINIYFVGDLRNQNNPTSVVNGNTQDPADAYWSMQGGGYPLRSHITISDRAFPPPFNGQVTVNLSEHVLEHEMCHFLIRRRAGLPGQSGYTVEEHDPNSGATHLMCASTPHGMITAADAQHCSQKLFGNAYLTP